MPKFDATLTISIVLAICALFAPSITAIINNRHHYKIRKLELCHDEYLHFSNMQYQNKYDVYHKFLDMAGYYNSFHRSASNLADIISALQNAMLLCDPLTLPLLLDFQKIIESQSVNNQTEYLKLLTQITKSFNRELSTLSRIYND